MTPSEFPLPGSGAAVAVLPAAPGQGPRLVSSLSSCTNGAGGALDFHQLFLPLGTIIPKPIPAKLSTTQRHSALQPSPSLAMLPNSHISYHTPPGCCCCPRTPLPSSPLPPAPPSPSILVGSHLCAIMEEIHNSFIIQLGI